MTLPERPLTVLIAALGGEGGGVLADWILAAANAEGYPVQSTSIPGVAQRTGATTYYLEIYPARAAELGGRSPVMTLAPAPGCVDVMIASELLEAARAMQNGFVTPDRTTLIASTHRIYTTIEKMAMGDGRVDSKPIINAARTLARRAQLFDMERLARESGTVISAVMFGALAGSGTLPLQRAACEAAIRDFQDEAYAALYLERMEQIAKLEREGAGHELTRETGRFLALWMCYEDVIRVADLKTRRSRIERVRKEVRAAPDEPVHVVEFLKPGLEELAALLPRGASRALVRWAGRRRLAQRLNVGMRVKSTSVSGFLMLRSLAWLRPWRRLSARYAEEQALIERWLAAIRGAAHEPALALEIALCGRLIKGYGETHRRGKDNFLRIMDTLVESDAVAGATARAAAIRQAREAALADPEGRGLEGSLATHGIAPLPPKAKPIKFVRKAA
jgi:indolepyruvate ferredoxin oxidoreductase beta subunit